VIAEFAFYKYNDCENKQKRAENDIENGARRIRGQYSPGNASGQRYRGVQQSGSVVDALHARIRDSSRRRIEKYGGHRNAGHGVGTHSGKKQKQNGRENKAAARSDESAAAADDYAENYVAEYLKRDHMTSNLPNNDSTINFLSVQADYLKKFHIL